LGQVQLGEGFILAQMTCLGKCEQTDRQGKAKHSRYASHNLVHLLGQNPKAGPSLRFLAALDRATGC
jgi:hypothetical protein